MKTIYIQAGIFVAALVMVAAVAGFVVASEADIQYPVPELGNCADKDACKAYCDTSAHMSACISFAEKNQLMSLEEINSAKKFMENGSKGPGDCTGKDSCETYCNDISHIDECVAYAEQTGIMSPQDLAEAKMVQSAISRGVKPPPCKNKKQCDAYCEDPANMKVCIAFGEEAGFLKGEELNQAKKMLTAIDNGATPPPCKGKEACDAYCSAPENMEVCMNFAKAAGFMSPEEAANSEKMLNAIRQGVKPPACKGDAECRTFCSQKEHVEECIAFSVAAGMMSEKDAQMMRETGGVGPGGCSSKEECEAFCGTPENQNACEDFGREHGMMPPEGSGPQGSGEQGPGGRQGPTTGPGGCKGPEECRAFCGKPKNQQACAEFGRQNGAPPQGQSQNGVPPQQQGMLQRSEPGDSRMTGPGGCSGREECQAFCSQSENQQTCAQFGRQNGDRTPQGDGQPPQSGMYQQQPPQQRDGAYQQMPQQREMGQPPPFGTYEQMPQQGQIQLQPRQEMQQQGEYPQLPPGDYPPPPTGSYIPPTGSYEQIPQEPIQQMAPQQEMMQLLPSTSLSSMRFVAAVSAIVAQLFRGF
ncbi:MAG: Single-stranded DNA-binding protein [Candidatus Kaiserbacteria bacterium GW2011_GWA2_52_12]|uniref:Single-stranded DNA-binding protein n=1 Tax=Candidatus Kaiserbacteria bacterium GW2011_GWA2_52_12 TaxID=1618671 RepID=A0A0G1Z879_9BACT|nr:MAG: Single-stranded DNA-binding protein [Candidatus Kaiserbacteria bacterium GW2011_GWA2_52_12]